MGPKIIAVYGTQVIAVYGTKNYSCLWDQKQGGRRHILSFLREGIPKQDQGWTGNKSQNKDGKQNKRSRGSLMVAGSGGAGGTLCCPTLTMSPTHSLRQSENIRKYFSPANVSHSFT